MKRQATNGFTIVELAVGMLAASILAVTLGVMLFVGYTNWTRTTRALDMQRDTTLAMQTLMRVLRGASLGGVDLSQSHRIDFTTNGVTQSFFQQGSNLLYNPNLTGGGTAFPLVRDRMVPASFTVSNITKGVGVSLQVREGSETMTLSAGIRLRN
jgi:hypothetical protein